MIQQVGEQASEVFAVAGQIVQLAQSAFDLAGQNGPSQIEELALSGKAEHRKHIRLLDFVAAKTDELVEGGLGIPHRAFRAASNGVEASGAC